MELSIALGLSILGSVLSVSTFVLNRKDKAVKDTKENHQPLIEYQLKELKENYKDIANDIKEIKKMLSNYKETVRDIVRIEMDEHIRQYHSKGE